MENNNNKHDTTQAWDLRNGEVSLLLSGHNDTVTSLALSPDGSKILSNSMDNSVRVWDINPFVFDESKRCISAFFGAQVRSSFTPPSFIFHHAFSSFY